MEWSLPDVLGPEALAFLRADPVRHTVVLGTLALGAVPGSAVVTLYADDADPTSTGIYRRLGCHEVLAWADLRLVR